MDTSKSAYTPLRGDRVKRWVVCYLAGHVFSLPCLLLVSYVCVELISLTDMSSSLVGRLFLCRFPYAGQHFHGINFFSITLLHNKAFYADEEL